MPNAVYSLQVYAHLPAPIARLEELASNFWFSWNPAARILFSRLDESLWLRTDNNPKLFLRCVDQGILERAAEDDTFLSAYRKVMAEFDAYVEQGPMPYKDGGLAQNDFIAYFCAEYGFHESFPIYSGGLGILAGDHCKTASDMRLPFVAVGLLYRQGYFNQHIDRHGQQIPEYIHIDPEHTALRPALDSSGAEVFVSCGFPGRNVLARVWRADVGRVPILLLDTDVEQNAQEDRRITHQLYGGDRRLRLQQEAVLGIGGVRALEALGYQPSVWHINEGHAAFLILERVRKLTVAGVPFRVALEAVAADTVFTTHTPVSAGHDVFAPELVLEHFSGMLEDFGVDGPALLELGRTANDGDAFNMTRLALSGARSINGVSRTHGRVSSELCRAAWPDVPPLENPVGYVTNGVHVHSFMRQPWADLLEQHLGPGWYQHLMERGLVERIREIPQERFWYTNQSVKTEMLYALRQRLARQHTRNGLSEAHIHRLLQQVDPNDPNVLTIGFARRFATYKRATLLFTDLRWLENLVRNDERPVLFVFAGKAHPADEPGQWMMREIQRISNQTPFLGKILLVEGYDAGLSRLLTSGVDVWLNTPIFPYEASGTSGMKAAINGTINLSVLDGWWAEGYDGENGWGIPPSIDTQDAAERDRQDATALYEILQDEVIPLYYARDPKVGFSPGWVDLCKRSMASVLPRFNSQRVMHDYARLFYGPAARQGREVRAADYRVARDLAEWKARVRAAWPGVHFASADAGPRIAGFGENVRIDVDVVLNGLRPADVRVECVLHRRLCSELTVPVEGYADNRRPQNGLLYIGDETAAFWKFEPQAELGGGKVRYRLEFQPPWAGGMQYEIRAVPQHPALSHPYELGLMRWL
ncbi:MAG TPA: alpha-glucan family phosphorylase [Gammaproteobacteria bacterium]|nr:alpha-glucan family phosphorylase [Gammaproteobacteria bacterium]